jgi:hypothetical protein
VHPKQIEALRRMTPAEKLRLAARFHHDARGLKAAGLRMLHPDWTDERVDKAVREAFLYARS